MGICGSSEKLSAEEAAQRKLEKDRSRALEQKMALQHNEEQAVNKLLLLGAGESGKSTLFKQITSIYGPGFTDDQKASYVPIIFSNVITSMKCLCKQSHMFGPVLAGNMPVCQYIEEQLKGDEPITPELAESFAQMWSDPGIQKTYEMRSHYQLTDSAKYFLDKIHEVSARGFLPTQQDVLRSRVRTTGIVEMEFVIDGNKFRMFDVGGQRNERKKWIHCFDNVTAVLFVAAMSEYDQLCYEDETTNRMMEALALFEEMCNSRWFHETSMVLFLNKRDLFGEKIIRVPLANCFPEYDGEDTYEAGIEFIKQQFESRNHVENKQVYTHVTCATDTDNVAHVFNDVKDTVIRHNLKDAGLIT